MNLDSDDDNDNNHNYNRDHLEYLDEKLESTALPCLLPSISMEISAKKLQLQIAVGEASPGCVQGPRASLFPRLDKTKKDKAHKGQLNPRLL